MAHDKVYGFCESKCMVEVSAKDNVDSIDARVGAIEEMVTHKTVIPISDAQTLYDEIQNMEVGDELIFERIIVVPDSDGADNGNIGIDNGIFKKVDENGLSGTCRVTVGDTSQTDGVGCHISFYDGTFQLFFSSVSDGVWKDGFYKVFTIARISEIYDCHIIRMGNATVGLNYEEWTFTLEDGTVVTKEVCVR